MASVAHVAVGLLAGRLHGGAASRTIERCSGGTLCLFSALAVLPDGDVFLVALGTSDAGLIGHRGASHSVVTAAVIGVLCALAARRLGWPVVRTAIAGTLAVGSHALLDVLSQGGRGLPLFWPLSAARFESPIRLFPDAPRGLALVSRAGLVNVAIELLIFFPVILYALWPNLAPLLWRRKVPVLTLIEGGAAAPPPALAVSHEAIPTAAAPGPELEASPLRSNG